MLGSFTVMTRQALFQVVGFEWDEESLRIKGQYFPSLGEPF